MRSNSQGQLTYPFRRFLVSGWAFLEVARLVPRVPEHVRKLRCRKLVVGNCLQLEDVVPLPDFLWHFKRIRNLPEKFLVWPEIINIKRLAVFGAPGRDDLLIQGNPPFILPLNFLKNFLILERAPAVENQQRLLFAASDEILDQQPKVYFQVIVGHDCWGSRISLDVCGNFRFAYLRELSWIDKVLLQTELMF